MADVPSQQLQKLIQLVNNGSVSQVQTFLSECAPEIINQLQPQNKHPALYFAALLPKQTATAMIDMLIKRGANLHFRDHNQQSVLFYIFREGNCECAQMILSHGLSLDQTDINGQTPLFYACSQNQLQIVNKFANKERVNLIDVLANQTPLFYAVRKGHTQMCKILLEKGADVNVTNSSGKSIIQIARRQKFTQIVEMLTADSKRAVKYNLPSQSIQESIPIERKKKKEETKPKQNFKIVYYNQKGETHDLTEQDVRQMIKEHPQLEEYLVSPEAIPQELIERSAVDNWQKMALKLLNQMVRIKGAFWFSQPVDPLKFNIADYFDIIQKPMDLGTVRKRLNHNFYGNVKQFIEDMELIWNNCYKYNGRQHDISLCAIELEAAFKQLLKSNGLKKEEEIVKVQ